MKKTILTSLVVLTGFTLSARAGTDMKNMNQASTATCNSDAGFYVAAYGGAQFDTSYGDNHQVLGGASTNTDIHSQWGGVGGIKAGYNFNSHPLANFMNLRIQPAVEAEALYIGDNSTSSGGIPGTTGQSFSSNSADFFVNGILRFKNSSIVTPYIGLGVGAQYLTTHGNFSTPGGLLTGYDTTDLDFAGQALFGIDVAICNHISLFSEYKFIDALGTDAKSAGNAGGTYRLQGDQLQQNLITAGVKYTF